MTTGRTSFMQVSPTKILKPWYGSASNAGHGAVVRSGGRVSTHGEWGRHGAAVNAASDRVTIRGHQRVWGVAVDVVAALASYEATAVAFSWLRGQRFELTTPAFDWGVVLALAVILCVFACSGLYLLEVWVSRPLHVLTLARATAVALLITAFFVITFRTSLAADSRLFIDFAAFFFVSLTLRLRLLDPYYRRDVRERPGGTVVVGWSADSGILVSRLRELRGYALVQTLEPLDRRRNGHDAEPRLVEAIRSVEPAPRQVFLDGGSLGHKATLDLIRAAEDRGADVYVTGRLVSQLDATGLLMHLFEMPVMRVHRGPRSASQGSSTTSRRAFDIVASVAALFALSPLYAATAIAIKLDSPGPIFFRQQRVGLDGRTFEFLKFRSMRVGNDSGGHQEYVARLIDGETEAALAGSDEWGRPVFKLADDERVTHVGRFLRKYSLDELPQFWNVLKGDMSIVGPRPALGYEVDAYKEWHRLRLQVMPGVSGLWQIAGRSRVGFDEMVFQDVMYGFNQGLLTDVHICLRTVPAVLMSRGAA